MIEFLKAGHKNYTKKDLIVTLEKLEIQKGDTICVHTELFKFGAALLPKKQHLSIYIEAILDVIGKNGTLIMPVFSYSFCKNEVYNKLYSKSKVGVLNEFFRLWEGVKRNNDPIFSFAIKGKNEKEFLKEHTSCFGENCVYDILSKINGKIILLGSKTNGYTFTHFIEEKAKVPYRYFKEFRGRIIFENNMSKNIKINYYVRKLDISSDLNVYKQIKILQEDNNFKVENFANSCIVSINANKYLQATLKALKKDAYCLL